MTAKLSGGSVSHNQSQIKYISQAFSTQKLLHFKTDITESTDNLQFGKRVRLSVNAVMNSVSYLSD